MALITSIQLVPEDRPEPHKPVKCSYAEFTDVEGERYLQLDTFGSPQRKFQGKTSQSIQLGLQGARELQRILLLVFPELRSK